MVYKVALVGDYPESPECVVGGVEAVLLYLSRALSQLDRFEIHVVTLDRWKRGGRQMSDGNLNVHYLKSSPLRTRLAGVDNTRRLANQLHALRPNLIHAHAANKYAIAASRTGLQWVLTPHGIRYQEAELHPDLLSRLYTKPLVRREERRAVASAPNLISINPYVEECLCENYAGTIFRIENPVAEQFFSLEQRNEPCRLLYVGRIIPVKDIITLIKAFAIVKREHPTATLYIAGQPNFHDPYTLEVQKQIHSDGVGDSVTLLGQLDEVELHTQFERASLVVLSSIVETAPMAIAEAMATGTAVVATDAGGSGHMIQEGRTGYLAEVGNHRAFAHCVAKALSTDPRALMMGMAARDNALTRFRESTIAKKTVEAYEAILCKP